MDRNYKGLATDITVAYLHAASSVSADYDIQELIKAETVAEFYSTIFGTIKSLGSTQNELKEEEDAES